LPRCGTDLTEHPKSHYTGVLAWCIRYKSQYKFRETGKNTNLPCTSTKKQPNQTL